MLICALDEIGQRIVDNIEFVDLSGKLLLYAAKSLVVGKSICSVDGFF